MNVPLNTSIHQVNTQFTFHRAFLPTWERFADREATSCNGVSRTFAEHRDRVFRLVDALGSELLIERTSRFAVLSLNSSEYIELYHAAYLGGGIINPLNIRLAAEEFVFILDDSGTEAVFVDKAFAPIVESIRDRVPTLRHVVLIGADDGLDDVRIDHRYDDLVAAGRALEPAEGLESDPVCLLYTGGTTGLPKGVLHTQRSHTLSARVGQEMFQLSADDRYLTTTPLFHGATLGAFLIAPFVGCPVSVMPMFTPAGFVDTVAESAATHTVLVPTMARMVIDSPDFDADKLKSLQAFMYGGSPMPLGVLTRLMDVLPWVDVIQGYGMTEGVPVSFLTGDDHRRGGDLLRSAGRPSVDVIVTVQDPDGNVLPSGETGELCMRSGNVMAGYWNRPDETTQAFRDGWYRSGDVGYVDADGYLYLVDRARDMIVSGGENVYSSEVESAISTHPAVADVAVIGIPSDEWGEAVHAVVVLHDGADATEDEIAVHSREMIAGYKVPRSVEFRADPLPVSGAGKTLKRALREPHWAGEDRYVN